LVIGKSKNCSKIVQMPQKTAGIRGREIVLPAFVLLSASVPPAGGHFSVLFAAQHIAIYIPKCFSVPAEHLRVETLMGILRGVP
jgi:hypothetical protein